MTPVENLTSGFVHQIRTDQFSEAYGVAKEIYGILNEGPPLLRATCLLMQASALALDRDSEGEVRHIDSALDLLVGTQPAVVYERACALRMRGAELLRRFALKDASVAFDDAALANESVVGLADLAAYATKTVPPAATLEGDMLDWVHPAYAREPSTSIRSIAAILSCRPGVDRGEQNSLLRELAYCEALECALRLQAACTRPS
jgi:hypothetical protein